MDPEEKPKWTWNTSVEVDVDADKVWGIFADFFGLKKWLPYLKECSPVERISGEPGCVRYCASPTGEVDSNGEAIIKWAKERLISIDHGKRSFRYDVIDSNIGYGWYDGTMTITPKGDVCKMEWFVVADPVEEHTHEEMAPLRDAILGAIAKAIEEAHPSPPTQH